jgi:hypothetical protein
MSNNLPDGDEFLKDENKYWRPSKMKEGENRIRIVCKPISGHIDWKDNKPLRYRPEAKPKPSDPLKPVKKFWMCYVWDYAREGLYMLELTQGGIISSLRAYANDEDYGDLTGYDIKITKKGTMKETKYSVTASPPKPMADVIKKALEAAPVHMEILYDGGDPWTDLEAANSKVKANDSLYEKVHVMLEKEPNKKKIMDGFCAHYKIGSLIEADAVALLELEKRLLEIKANREKTA